MQGLGNSNNKSNVINRAVIDMLITAIIDNDARFIASLGINSTAVGVLKKLPATDLHRMLNSFGSQLIDVQINEQAIQLFQAHIQAESGHEDTLDLAIRLGARYPMLRELTGISRQEYEQKRAILSIDAPSRGRIELLDEHSELQVWDAWQKEQEPNPLRRFCLVAKKTQIGIEQIWQSLQSLNWEAEL